MSTTTTNYDLIKPELTDAADITAMNTNWDTIDALLKNMSTEGWLTPVTTANEDLDNYVTQGIYSFGSAYAPINRPTDNSNGWLIVIPWNNNAGVGTVKQIWLRHGTLNSNDHCLYVRTRIGSNNAWSSWAQIYTSKDITANLTELGYLSGVTSAIQTQLNGKQASITGAASTIASSNLTTGRALVSNSSGKVSVSNVTSTELGYIDGVTSNVQTQLDNRLPLSGGVMTGDIQHKRGNVTNTPIKVTASSNDYGNLLQIGAGGDVIIGSGEANTGLASAESIDGSNEVMYIGSDTEIKLFTNCNTIANRKEISIDTNGRITVPSGATPYYAYNLTTKKYVDDNKVDKAGDTMTAMLTFNNPDAYHAIHKVRTINGSSYGINFGCGILGGEGTITMELRSGTSTTGTQLSRLEIGKLGVSYVDQNGSRHYLHKTSVVEATIE